MGEYQRMRREDARRVSHGLNGRWLQYWIMWLQAALPGAVMIYMIWILIQMGPK